MRDKDNKDQSGQNSSDDNDQSPTTIVHPLLLNEPGIVIATVREENEVDEAGSDNADNNVVPGTSSGQTIHRHHHLNPFTNIFNLHHHRNLSDNNLTEYSSESLLYYVREGDLSRVKEILSNTINLGTLSKAAGGSSSAYNTVTSGGTVSGVPKRPKIDLETTDDAKQTPLILATRYDYTDIARVLIEHGSKVNAIDADSWSPLLNAAKNGNLELVELLLSHRAFIEDRDLGGFTPLMWACYKNHAHIVHVLLANGANCNAYCKNNISCLCWAAGRANEQVVAELLKCSNIKVNFQDVNNSTPLLWAARKGSLKIVQALIDRGARTDIAGMNNMTPLIMSCKNGHTAVALLLSKVTTSINHADKDENSALRICAKNGYTEVAMSLLERGAYVNSSNKKGDSVLTIAVKGGHKPIVEALLAKSVEIDLIGKEGKTAMHHAIEKANLDIAKLLLAYKPDLEIANEEGDTPLLLATKKKNVAIVNELLNAGSRVSPTDRNGDNVLHISLRNRSREITELILSNPKNSKYLYKPNKKGETPYKIDASNPKSILTQVFGARQLNMTEDNILGYDLYSGALAEILSEPSLHTPITVGLYAKWGSGKSFLISQLKAEMKSFAKLTNVVNLKIDFFLIIAIVAICLLVTSPILLWKWRLGLVVFFSICLLAFATVFVSKYFYEIKEKEWAEKVCRRVSNQVSSLKLLLRILFLNPFTNYHENTLEHKNLRFIFAEYGKISTIGGESALALMISSIYSKMELQLGVLLTRLCRVFHTRMHSHSRFKRVCGVPTFLVALVFFTVLVFYAIFLRLKGFNLTTYSNNEYTVFITISSILIGLVLLFSPTWSRVLWNVMRSPARLITSAYFNKNKKKFNSDPSVSKDESFVFKLKREVDLIAHTCRTIDAFTHSCTRLVIMVDGLDSCEQSKVLQVLEIIHVLFTKENDPFVCIVAVDPHVLMRGIEGNMTLVFKNGNLNGHDYLRTIIHLPVFLQVDLSKAKALASNKYNVNKKNTNLIGSIQDMIKIGTETNDKKKRKRAVSKPMSAYDLTDQLIKSDYFSDVNPRNLRRLINIIAMTGRLLRAYHIEFNWRQLASWIYLVEQWPYRCSWLVMFYEDHEAEIGEEVSFVDIYERVKHMIPISNEPLLELDRNARKFEQFIQNSEPKLNCGIMKKILPCTCNLDPYLIKLIKDSIEANNEKLIQQSILNSSANDFQLANPYLNSQSNPGFHQFCYRPEADILVSQPVNELTLRKRNHLTSIMEDKFEIDSSSSLKEMSVRDVCEAIQSQIELMSAEYKKVYIDRIAEKNVNGAVLSTCDLGELKEEIKMTFGDWELFKNWILYKRISQSKLTQQQSRLVKPFDLNNNFRRQTSSESSTHQEISPRSRPTSISGLSSPPLISVENYDDNKTESRVRTNSMVTPTTTRHVMGRKVEFTVTPVHEKPNLAMKTERSASVAVAPNNSQTESDHDEVRRDRIGSMSDSYQHNTMFTIGVDQNESIPLMSLDSSHSGSANLSTSSHLTKIGKLFKSIDSLIHKGHTDKKTSEKAPLDPKSKQESDHNEEDESEEDGDDDEEEENESNKLNQSLV